MHRHIIYAFQDFPDKSESEYLEDITAETVSCDTLEGCNGWLSNHAFTGACAGDYTRANGYETVQCHIPRLTMQMQQVPVVERLEC
jgi:hypothetical protein